MIEYSENEKIISIRIGEDIASNNKFMVLVNRSSFQRWNDGTYISLDKQMEIIKNFTDGVNFLELEVGILD